MRLRESLLLRDARGKTREQPQAPPIRLCEEGLAIDSRCSPRVQLTAGLERNPKVDRVAGLSTFKALCGDADYGERHAFDIESAAQNIGRAGETARPILVAEDDHGRVLRFVLRTKTAAACDMHAKAGEEISADHIAFGDFGAIAYTHCRLAAVAERNISNHVGERVILTAERVIYRPGKG